MHNFNQRKSNFDCYFAVGSKVNFMKKIVITTFSVLFGLLLLLSLGIYFAIRSVDSNFLVKTMESKINSRVGIESVDISLFSAISGVTINGISIGTRDGIANKGVPYSERKDKFTSRIFIKSAKVRISFLSLLEKKIKLLKATLQEPNVAITLFADGSNDLSGLFKPPAIVEGKPNPDLSKEALAKRKQEELEKANSPSKPFSIKDIPVAIFVDSVGIENGTVKAFLQKKNQTITLSDLVLKVQNVKIDPTDLKNKNSLDLVFDTNLLLGKNPENPNSKFILHSEGTVNPFVIATGLVNPAVEYQLVVAKDSFVTALPLLDGLSGSLPALSGLGLSIPDVDKKQVLERDTKIKIRYGKGRVTFLETVQFYTRQFELHIREGGWIQVTEGTHLWNGDLIANEKESKKSLAQLDANFAKAGPKADDLKKQVYSQILTENRLKLPFTSSGDMGSPNLALAVTLPSLADLLKGAIKNEIKDKLKSQIPGPAKDVLKGFGL